MVLHLDLKTFVYSLRYFVMLLILPTFFFRLFVFFCFSFQDMHMSDGLAFLLISFLLFPIHTLVVAYASSRRTMSCYVILVFFLISCA